MLYVILQLHISVCIFQVWNPSISIHDVKMCLKQTKRMTRKIVSLDTIVQITIAAKVRKRKTQY